MNCERKRQVIKKGYKEGLQMNYKNRNNHILHTSEFNS